jgi:uncharacterized protein (DUF433 family)
MTLLDNLVAEPPPLRVDADGVVRVGGTRVTLDTVVAVFQQGAQPAEIVERFDTLRLEDVYTVIGYYLRHRVEVDAYLEQRRQHADAVRREHEARFPREGLRERLLARRKATG